MKSKLPNLTPTRLPLMIAVLAIVGMTSLVQAQTDAQTSTPSSPVGMKCQFMYWGLTDQFDVFVKDIKLVGKAYKEHMNYKFDHIETVKVPGKPDVKIWVHGNYFHNQNEIDSYLRLTMAACENKPGTGDLKCYAADYSGDIFAHVVTRRTPQRGKKVQVVDSNVNAVEPAKGLEVLANYRMRTGRSMTDDLDLSNPVHRNKYEALIAPIIGTSCSIRDNAFGVVSVY